MLLDRGVIALYNWRMLTVIVSSVILGFESTAHTFGVSVVSDGSVLSNESATYTTESGGMIPYEVADHHESKWQSVLGEAFDEAGVEPGEVDAVAFSQGPGIGHTLRVGATVAKSVATRLDVGLVPVNHCVAHLEVGRLLSQCQDPVLLYVSGANTQVIAYKAGRYRVFGETLDMGVGNLLDSVAREFGYGFPGGPALERAAKNSETLVDIPYSVKGMDVSLGGLFTKVKRLYHNEGVASEDLAFSVQETVFAMMTEVAERAMAHTEKDDVVLGGGVACNERLQGMVESMAANRGGTAGWPDDEFLVDNAAMIALTGELLHGAGKIIDVSEAVIKPGQRTDDVEVVYRD
jgi:glycoprotease/Kae1 family metallohydrolase